MGRDGALVCSRCKALVPARDERSHVCKDAPVADDAAARSMMARIGKKCPACGMFIEKNEGCSTMMCGTDAHGRMEDALRNGGCGHEFNWLDMTPRNYGRPGAPYNDRQVNF